MNTTTELLQSTFSQLNSELQTFSEQQTTQSNTWTNSVDNLNIVLKSAWRNDLRPCTAAAQQFESLMPHTLTASSNFHKASETLTATFPSIEKSRPPLTADSI